MDSEVHILENRLFERVVKILKDLGPFSADALRNEKWRTTEQLAYELGLFDKYNIDFLEKILKDHESKAIERLHNGLTPNALLRSAKYPDRTSALTLWGSVEYHGQPWLEKQPYRMDQPDDIPETLFVDNDAPAAFLSHTCQDKNLAINLAEELAKREIRSWMYETHIQHRGIIAECVRKAIRESDCILNLVTRDSIASLWILTELHTAVEGNKPVALILNSDDIQLLELFESVRFQNPDEDFDHSVECNWDILEILKKEYSRHQGKSRSDRYKDQAKDFLKTLPMYLRIISPDTGQKILGPAYSFPNLPSSWCGAFTLCSLEEFLNKFK